MTEMDDVISFEQFIKEAVDHKISQKLLVMFEIDCILSYPDLNDKPLRNWLVILEVWAQLAKEALATQLLDEFNSDSRPN